jgi:hypothetical protein
MDEEYLNFKFNGFVYYILIYQLVMVVKIRIIKALKLSRNDDSLKNNRLSLYKKTLPWMLKRLFEF